LKTVRIVQSPSLSIPEKKKILENLTKGKLSVEFKESPVLKPRAKLNEEEVNN